MKATLNAKELLNLSKISGILAAIADSMSSEEFNKESASEKLFELSDDLFNLVTSQIEILESKQEPPEQDN